MMEAREQDVTDAEASSAVGRRELMKALGAAGSLTALEMTLPRTWLGPLVEIGALPAHAQTSACVVSGRESAKATKDPMWSYPVQGCVGSTIYLSLVNAGPGACFSLQTGSSLVPLSARVSTPMGTTTVWEATVPSVAPGLYTLMVQTSQGASDIPMAVRVLATCDGSGDMDAGMPGDDGGPQSRDAGMDAAAPSDAGADAGMTEETCTPTGSPSLPEPTLYSVYSGGCAGSRVVIEAMDVTGTACVRLVPGTADAGVVEPAVDAGASGGLWLPATLVPGGISSSQQFEFTLPDDIEPGTYVLSLMTANGPLTYEYPFVVYAMSKPVVTSVTPTTAEPNTQVTITGSGLGDVNSVVFRSASSPYYGAIESQSDTEIVVTVPSYVSTTSETEVVLMIEGQGYCEWPSGTSITIEVPDGGLPPT